MGIVCTITKKDKKDEVGADHEAGVETDEIKIVTKDERRREKKNQDIMNEKIELIMIDMIRKDKGNWKVAMFLLYCF